LKNQKYLLAESHIMLEVLVADLSISGKTDISIVLCGAAGQGIQTIEHALTRIFKTAGFNVYATKEYMSRIRGGSNSTAIRISSERVTGVVDRIDFLIPLDKDALPHLKKRIKPETVILGEKENMPAGFDVIDMPFSKIALEVGNLVYANMVAVGALSCLFGIDHAIIEDYARKQFSRKGEQVVSDNLRAAAKGCEAGKRLVMERGIKFGITPNAGVRDELLLSGAEAVALGAMTGGCNFIAAYPMTPSTGVFTFLSQHGVDFGMIAEQAEDEISAMNMALGAWYAGARALVTTSGGGFSLMVEGLSLAGMLETPVVINLGQRPGPATGLPTRTEQGELLFALHAGHGEFPRVIYAPGTLEDAFFLTQRAFNLADEYQIPVFVLTDQHLMDSYYNLPGFDISGLKVEKRIVKTALDYGRYRITDSGISPRGIPGYGEGLVVLDSDEHDEEGHITEDLDLRKRMVEKRLRKAEDLRAKALLPEVVGRKDYKKLVVCWGSTFPTVKEAVSKLDDSDMAILYFKQVYPLNPAVKQIIERARKTVIVENNATGQFNKLLKQSLGVDVERKILKYNGLPFTVEELVGRLEEE
jgi:2-oxoglutarate ferredoxin oxidoreductase subunit alpha